MATLDLEPIKERLAAATPGPWDFYVLPQSVGITVATIHSEQGPRETCWTADLPPEIGGMGTEKDAEMIAHAPEDIAALIAEVETLRGQVEAVRALHRPAHAVFSWNGGTIYEDPCPQCHGAPGVHPCGCWADTQLEYVCAECHRLGVLSKGVYDYTYPCPTIHALGVGE